MTNHISGGKPRHRRIFSMPEHELTKISGIATLADFRTHIAQIQQQNKKKKSSLNSKKATLKSKILNIFSAIDTDTSTDLSTKEEKGNN